MSPSELADLGTKERAMWERVVRLAQIKAD